MEDTIINVDQPADSGPDIGINAGDVTNTVTITTHSTTMNAATVSAAPTTATAATMPSTIKRYIRPIRAVWAHLTATENPHLLNSAVCRHCQKEVVSSQSLGRSKLIGVGAIGKSFRESKLI